jgi:hypothetical protein
MIPIELVDHAPSRKRGSARRSGFDDRLVKAAKKLR